jgi:hypothetical protein
VKIRKLLGLLLATLLILAIAAPASAREHNDGGEPIFLVALDLEHGISVWWNITPENFCSWEAGGYEGPPPVDELVPANIYENEEGGLAGSYRATRSMELWQLDDDVPPAIGPCEDIENQDGPWATGSAEVISQDNDFEGDTLPVNIFGDKGRGTVYDGDGAPWSFSWVFRIWDGDGIFQIVEEVTLEML